MEAERRQITVLFTDMVGFTTFSERSGEEAVFTLMRRLAKLMDEAVREQGGVVQGFTGDGIMAVFGAPRLFCSTQEGRPRPSPRPSVPKRLAIRNRA
ncbi:MAG: adenylate/guanylate cyclase domain-containing protein [Rhodomicrobium sp.]